MTGATEARAGEGRRAEVATEAVVREVGAVMAEADRQWLSRLGHSQSVPSALPGADRAETAEPGWTFPDELSAALADLFPPLIPALRGSRIDRSPSDAEWAADLQARLHRATIACREVDPAVAGELTDLGESVSGGIGAEPERRLEDRSCDVLYAVSELYREVSLRTLSSDAERARDFALNVYAPQREDVTAKLLGVSTRTLTRWRAGTTPVSSIVPRVTTIAVVTFMVIGGFRDSDGMLSWWYRPRTQIGGATPADLLSRSEEAGKTQLVSLARGGLR